MINSNGENWDVWFDSDGVTDDFMSDRAQPVAEAKLRLLRRDIQLGLDDLARGAVVDGEKAFRNLDREFD